MLFAVETKTSHSYIRVESANSKKNSGGAVALCVQVKRTYPVGRIRVCKVRCYCRTAARLSANRHEIDTGIQNRAKFWMRLLAGKALRLVRVAPRALVPTRQTGAGECRPSRIAAC